MNFESAMTYIHSRMRFGSKLGLERMCELLSRLGNPQNQLKFVHVAGTNGKGSTVSMLSAVLQSAGYKTGRFISPYVFDFCERIAVNDEMISEEALGRLTERVSLAVKAMETDGWDAVTEFEIVTAIGFLYFAEEKCDIVVLEVGLGGRFDATNVIETTLVAVITSISLDHTKILGDTVEKIAAEKCGIIKPNIRVVLYPIQTQSVLKLVQDTCRTNKCALVVPDVNELSVQDSSLLGNRFIYQRHTYQQKLVGRFQVYNALTVLETVEQLRCLGFSIPESAVFSGIYSCHMDARFDVVSKHPTIILDAGHNPQGIDALSESLAALKNRRLRVVFTVMKDKEYQYAIEKLAGVASSFYATSLPENPRALGSAEIAEIAKKHCKNVFAFNQPEDAILTAYKDMGNDILLICGSFYIMERAKKILKNSGLL